MRSLTHKRSISLQNGRFLAYLLWKPAIPPRGAASRRATAWLCMRAGHTTRGCAHRMPVLPGAAAHRCPGAGPCPFPSVKRTEPRPPWLNNLPALSELQEESRHLKHRSAFCLCINTMTKMRFLHCLKPLTKMFLHPKSPPVSSTPPALVYKLEMA